MLEDAVLNQVEKLKPNLLDLVQKLIRIPSENPPGDEQDVAQLLSGVLSEIGFKVDQYEVASKRINVAATLRGKGEGRSILFNGHTDVVPAGPRELWKKDPFGGEFDGTRIWGRGSADMKGALASMVIALRALADSDVALGGDVVLHAVVDEEANSLGTKYMVEKNLAKADLAIVAEGSVANESIYIRPSVRGICWLTVKTVGRAAHASNPANGVNAILGMSKLLLALENLRLPHEPHKILPSPTISPGTVIRGGIKTNVIPPECYADVDIRTVPGMNKNEVLSSVRDVIDRIQKENPGLTANITNVIWGAPAEIPMDHYLVQVAKRATKRVTGYEPEFRGGYGTNDSRLLINDAKIPTLCGFGPGDDSQSNAHGPNENVSLASLLTFAKIYGLMSLWICEGKQ
jgi:succinyl-diaminopimelate desuccinylase